MHLEPVIGLEIHVQLKTKSKMFCGCDNTGEDQSPNTTVCPICMGHPGALPVINREAVNSGIRAGLALNCAITPFSKFDRKNYFYPDSPKGYQISQYDEPICQKGNLEITIPARGQNRTGVSIRINRIHLEDDAAKSQHDGHATLVDFNRAGTPLIEIVTEPDFKTPEEAKIFLNELRLIMRYLDVSSADMEKGHLRCDANISMREVLDDPAAESGWADQLNPKTEIKNINSFRAVERALEYEIKRQTAYWEEKGQPIQESTTRGWNEAKGVTEAQRAKEASHDYRYFPEPDLPPMELTDLAEKLKTTIPELPAGKRLRFIEEYGFSPADAVTLVEDKHLANYTERVVSELVSWLSSLDSVEGSEDEIWEKHKKELSRLVSGWLISKLGGILADKKIDWRINPVTPENFAEFLSLLYENKLNSALGRSILEEMVDRKIDPHQIIEEKGIKQMSGEDELAPLVMEIVEANPKAKADWAAGKLQAIKFLLGQVMAKTKGQADPVMAEKLIKKVLGN